MDLPLREQLSTLSTSLPTLWASSRLRREQQKDRLRSLIRRVVLTRQEPESVEVTIIGVSGVSSRLAIHPTVGQSIDVRNHAQGVERVVTLSAAGFQDREIARQLAARGIAFSPPYSAASLARASDPHSPGPEHLDATVSGAAPG